MARAELIPPETSLTKTPDTPNGTNGWYTVPVTISLVSTDLESGVKELHYKLDEEPWVIKSFSNTQNLLPNPSFEQGSGTSSGLAGWTVSGLDPEVEYAQDTTTFALGYPTASARISALGGLWHGINTSGQLIQAGPFETFSGSLKVKTSELLGTIKILGYSIVEDENGQDIPATIFTKVITPTSPTMNWTNITYNFALGARPSKGLYIEIGIVGSGVIWFDAATLIRSTPLETTFSVANDARKHTIEYFSVDMEGNEEAHTCSAPTKNCFVFYIDQTPPTNWRDASATRSLSDADYLLWVTTKVSDATSGLKALSDKYQIHTEVATGFGHFRNPTRCEEGTWFENQWRGLASPPFQGGIETATITTPKTSYCNNNWKLCKTARFYIEDMAGNSATKDYCINGPWIKLRGGGAVRSNQNISMLSEPDEKNTDGMIELVGTSVGLFASTTNWKATGMPLITAGLDYDSLWNTTSRTKIPILNGLLDLSSGVYYITGNYVINTSKLAANFDTATFKKIIFINGSLTIAENVKISKSSVLLFIVRQDVRISKNVGEVAGSFFSNSTIYTAYDMNDGESIQPLTLKGLYTANKFVFQRTLQGTDNISIPSETFIYEPKYILKLKDYFITNKVKVTKNY